MKNLKTKMGITAAACLLTLGLAVKNVNAEYKPDPNIEKVVDTIMFDYPSGCSSSYELPDGRTVKFVFYGSTGELYIANFSVDIVKRHHKLSNYTETVRIRDTYLNGLGEDDLIGYKIENHNSMSDEPKFEFKEFTELSKETQERLKKEYMEIIIEAPKRIAEKYQARELQKIKEKKAKEEMFERNLLDVMISRLQP